MNNITKIIEIDDIYSFEGQKNIVEQMCTHLGFVTIENHPDILNISKEEKNSIGIKEIQHLTKWISTKPYNHTSKVVFISHGDLLTHEAQNSLLKITEEPPPYANIFILVNSHKNLLETIVSRSEVLNKKTTTRQYNPVDEFVNMKVEDKLKFCDKKSKDDQNALNNFFNELINYYRTSKNYHACNKMLEYKDLLNRNVNKKLILFNICLLE